MHHTQVAQSPIANDFLKVKMMVTLNCKFFQNCDCRCISENFIAILLAPKKMVDSKNQEMKMIISLSVILHCVHYCHPNLKNVINIKGYVWFWMLHICQKYEFIITIMAWSLLKKTQVYQPKWSEQKVWGKRKSTNTKLIKINSCHMGVVFMPNIMIWQRQQCVHTHSKIMRYHTENVYCDVVPNIQELILLTRIHIISIPTQVLQFVFTFIIWLHVVQNMAGFR